jgi:hypothetical protein
VTQTNAASERGPVTSSAAAAGTTSSLGRKGKSIEVSAKTNTRSAR